jgi:DNA-binding response OmpR family regulator
MCDRCEELEERVAWLESELGMQRDAQQFQKLHDAMAAAFGSKRNRKEMRCGQPVELLLALYRAKGSVVSVYQLLERIPSPNDKDRDAKIVSVWVYFARALLGKDIIDNVWGRGYRLSDTGMQRVKEILDAA